LLWEITIHVLTMLSLEDPLELKLHLFSTEEIIHILDRTSANSSTLTDSTDVSTNLAITQFIP